MNQTIIKWHTETVPDRVALSFVQSAIGSNRRMRHAKLEIHPTDEVDPEGTINIIHQDYRRMISPGDAYDLIMACLN